MLFRSDLVGGLVGVLNELLSADPEASDDDSVCTGDCHVLALAIGPVDLSLLGLNVSLDDCADGPVQVCVSATRSEGLLGSLLCGLAGGQGLNLDLGDITTLLTRAGTLLQGGLTPREAGELRSLLGRLAR